MKRRGWFITFEGPEGSGKSTQIQAAAKFLQKSGYTVTLLREPGGTRISERIREILLDKHLGEMNAETELFLYLAARAQIVREKILPALQKGNVVICDRFEDSTLAYQGFGRKLSQKVIEQASRLVRGALRPDLTFVLDIEPVKGLKRGGRHDRIEREAISFHQRVRQGFLTLAKQNPKRMVVLDSGRPCEWVRLKIQEKLEHVFAK